MEATSSRFTFQPTMIAPNSTPPPMARSAASPDLPPGFRFHPTDEELIVHYLRNQVTSRPCPVSIISELNIYKFDPWELPSKTEYTGEEEWYFFSPRDRKYPNGARPNRATASGYWKATGTDKAIYSGSRYVGVKKALVFYKGRPPKGVKSDWVMHEYRLGGAASPQSAKPKGSIRLDDWVLCRIYQKKQQKKAVDDDWSDCMVASPSMEGDKGAVVDQDIGETPQFPRSCSLAHLLEAEYISLGEMLNDYPTGPGDEFHAIANGFGSAGGDEHVDVVSQFLVDDGGREVGGGTEERIGSSQFGILSRGAADHSIFQYF